LSTKKAVAASAQQPHAAKPAPWGDSVAVIKYKTQAQLLLRV